MATITPGTGGTIKAPTLEGQIIEALVLARLTERDSTKNPQNRNYIQCSTNLNTSTFTFNASLPLEQTINPQGQVTYIVPDYFVGLTFNAGTGGTFKSSNIAAYIMEVITYAQNLEAITSKNPTGANNVNGTIDTDTTLFSCSGTLPITFSQNTLGDTILTASKYLETL